MKKLSKEKKAILTSLAFHMKQIESSMFAIINEVDSDSYPSTDKSRRVARLKQILLSLKVEYNNIKLRYGGNDSQD